MTTKVRPATFDLANWDPSEHPRGPDGRFISTGGAFRAAAKRFLARIKPTDPRYDEVVKYAGELGDAPLGSMVELGDGRTFFRNPYGMWEAYRQGYGTVSVSRLAEEMVAADNPVYTKATDRLPDALRNTIFANNVIPTTPGWTPVDPVEAWGQPDTLTTEAVLQRAAMMSVSSRTGPPLLFKHDDGHVVHIEAPGFTGIDFDEVDRVIRMTDESLKRTNHMGSQISPERPVTFTMPSTWDMDPAVIAYVNIGEKNVVTMNPKTAKKVNRTVLMRPQLENARHFADAAFFSDDENLVAYAITHELGHISDQRAGHIDLEVAPGRQATVMSPVNAHDVRLWEEQFNVRPGYLTNPMVQFLTAQRPLEPTLSGYGQGHPSEAYAEAYASYFTHLTYPTEVPLHPVASVYADTYGWGRPHSERMDLARDEVLGFLHTIDLADWDPAEHPRGPDGRFVSTGGALRSLAEMVQRPRPGDRINADGDALIFDDYRRAWRPASGSDRFYWDPVVLARHHGLNPGRFSTPEETPARSLADVIHSPQLGDRINADGRVLVFKDSLGRDEHVWSPESGSGRWFHAENVQRFYGLNPDRFALPEPTPVLDVLTNPRDGDRLRLIGSDLALDSWTYHADSGKFRLLFDDGSVSSAPAKTPDEMREMWAGRATSWSVQSARAGEDWSLPDDTTIPRNSDAPGSGLAGRDAVPVAATRGEALSTNEKRIMAKALADLVRADKAADPDDFALEYQQLGVPHAQREVRVSDPTTGDFVGRLRWYPWGEIAWIEVAPARRREGVATMMVALANQNEKVYHSEDLLAPGRKFAEATPMFLPEGHSMSLSREEVLGFLHSTDRLDV